MKKLLSIICLLCICASLTAGKFGASVNYLVFHLPDDTSYLELQYLILGNGLMYTAQEDGGFQGRVQVDVSLQSKTDNSRIDRCFHLLTATYPDASQEGKENNFNLSRIPAPADMYTLYVCMRDENDTNSQPFCFSSDVDLRFDRQKVSMSSIQCIEAYDQAQKESIFNKNGLTIVPYFSDYYPSEVNKLNFMQEIYNTDKVTRKQEKCKLTAYISHSGENIHILQMKKTRMFEGCQKYVYLCSFPIDSLPSGNYYLHTRVVDPDGNELACDSIFFQRSNPGVGVYSTNPLKDSISIDTLRLYVDYLTPIAKKNEIDFIRSAKKQDYQSLANFFYDFWNRRNADDPWDEWFRYYGNVKRVNHNYSTLRFKGYRTDRGFYYLKYGAPSDIEYYPLEDGLNPYEIWRYYQLEDQTDVYFIFGDLDLTTKDYTMICSNKKDEIYDPRWKFRLKPKDVRPASIYDVE